MILASIFASFSAPFGIIFRYFFGIDFSMLFGMPFFRFLHSNWLQKLSRDVHFSLPKSTLAPKAIFGCILVVLWLPFGSLLLTLASIWHPLAPFSHPLAPFWFTFGSHSLHFGSLLASLRSLLRVFGLRLALACSLLPFLLLHLAIFGSERIKSSKKQVL